MILVSANRNVTWMRLRTLALAAIVALAVGTVVAPPAHAQTKSGKVEDNQPPQVLVGPNCDVTGYKGEQRAFVPPISIPDDDPFGITTPPIILPADGDLVDDVIVLIQLSHTWVGDLIVTLTYDLNCGGPGAKTPTTTAAVSATLVCRPDATGDPAATPVPCGLSDFSVGCSSNLSCNNAYRFSDEGTAIMGIGSSCGTSATILPAGCYRPGGPGASPLAVFRGMPKGGCWTLHISDNAFLDLGTLCSWGIFVRNHHPVPTLQTSWGQLKNHYR